MVGSASRASKRRSKAASAASASASFWSTSLDCRHSRGRPRPASSAAVELRQAASAASAVLWSRASVAVVKRRVGVQSSVGVTVLMRHRLRSGLTSRLDLPPAAVSLPSAVAASNRSSSVVAASSGIQPSVPTGGAVELRLEAASASLSFWSTSASAVARSDPRLAGQPEDARLAAGGQRRPHSGPRRPEPPSQQHPWSGQPRGRGVQASWLRWSSGPVTVRHSTRLGSAPSHQRRRFDRHRLRSGPRQWSAPLARSKTAATAVAVVGSASWPPKSRSRWWASKRRSKAASAASASASFWSTLLCRVDCPRQCS